MKLFDGAFDAADAYVTGIQQAVAAKAAGIITISIDCDTIEPALKVAAAAGIETVNAGGFDCNLSTPGQKPKFTASLEDSSRYPNTEAFAEAEGAAEADWLAAATTGHGKIIQFGLSGNLLTAGIQRGFDQQLHAVCPGCSLIQTVTLSEAQVNSPSSVAQVAQSALLKSPTANAVETPHDTFNLEGISQAIVASGRKQTIKAVAGDGTAGGIALVKQAAGLNGEAMYSTPWSGWAASDCLNRLFAHSACVAEGIGLQLGDSAHGLPSAGAVGYKPPVAYVADYERVWSSK